MDEYGVFSQALKWTALVFAAGFVGYFGKYLGIKVISLLKKDETKKDDLPGKVRGESSDGESVITAGQVTGEAHQDPDNVSKKQKKEQLKQAKKLGKAMANQQKKNGNR